MSFVPIVTPVATPPSRQTQELADLLGRVIQEYEGTHPTVTAPEVRQALVLARRSSTRGGGQSVGMLIGVVAMGVALMVGLLVFYMRQGGGGLDIGSSPIMISIGALGVVAGLVAFLKRMP